jgi:hypothetical protein
VLDPLAQLCPLKNGTYSDTQPLAQPESERQATIPGLAALGTFWPVRAWRPGAVACLARQLGGASEPLVGQPLTIGVTRLY